MRANVILPPASAEPTPTGLLIFNWTKAGVRTKNLVSHNDYMEGTRQEESDALLESLCRPPDGIPQPIVATVPQLLRFEDLTPTNFERLVLRIASNYGDVVHAQLYGAPGQVENGIDLYCRLAGCDSSSPKYRTIQCRNTKSLSAAHINKAIDNLLAGQWASSTETFVIATRASAVPTQRANAIEAAAARLGQNGIKFEVWDAEFLSERLQKEFDLVARFFGRPTAEIFCLPAQPEAPERNDGERNAANGKRRSQLTKSASIPLVIVMALAGAFVVFQQFGSLGPTRYDLIDPALFDSGDAPTHQVTADGDVYSWQMTTAQRVSVDSNGIPSQGDEDIKSIVQSTFRANDITLDVGKIEGLLELSINPQLCPDFALNWSVSSIYGEGEMENALQVASGGLHSARPREFIVVDLGQEMTEGLGKRQSRIAFGASIETSTPCDSVGLAWRGVRFKAARP